MLRFIQRLVRDHLIGLGVKKLFRSTSSHRKRAASRAFDKALGYAAKRR